MKYSHAGTKLSFPEMIEGLKFLSVTEKQDSKSEIAAIRYTQEKLGLFAEISIFPPSVFPDESDLPGKQQKDLEEYFSGMIERDKIRWAKDGMIVKRRPIKKEILQRKKGKITLISTALEGSDANISKEIYITYCMYPYKGHAIKVVVASILDKSSDVDNRGVMSGFAKEVMDLGES